ncbi:uncharacterized protein LOC129722502 isoform X2 [Wyeomyia smithii]|nr:uncharacterized protein LOC129722502 isoform X2 [Wyeomyia smithii]XP_055531942.1 uncharacterized protein LOC129722502 isoform X2 [Wyeomyia smithii]
MQRPSPSTTSITPTTPIAPRNSITAPVPVDHAKQREMEFHKIKTLRLMLEQEKKNLENLNSSHKQRTPESVRAEATIKKLQEELAQMCGEDTSYPPYLSATSPLFPQPQVQNTSTPAFLSRFPRSLSSLSLGTKKKSTDKDTNISSPNAECLSPTGAGGGHLGNHHGPFGQPLGSSGSGNAGGSPTKKKYSSSNVSDRNHKLQQQHSQDIPPPLPQRNIPKRSESAMDSVDTVGTRRNIVVSDLDHSVLTTSLSSGSNKYVNNNNNINSGSNGKNNNKSRKKKNSNLSDIKAEQTMYHHGTERGGGGELQAEPPPLPPRQPGMMEVNQTVILNNDNAAASFGRDCNSNTNSNSNNHSRVNSPETRPPPNSINTLMNYPLITTCTPVRDNMNAAAFPLSQRPNIVHQMAQHQQQAALNAAAPTAHMNQPMSKKHRRIVSSPENISPKEYSDHSAALVPRHQKTSSDSWDKRSQEITPPGTPPPPYPSSSLIGSGAGGGSGHLHHDHTTAGDLAIAASNHLHQQQQQQQHSVPSATTIIAAQANVAQKPIISMEDDEISDQESFIEEHGPFRSLSQLLEPAHSAHLAVFLNFVLSNSDPSPLLFYLITALYKEGSIKDMRKWAYEIHSTFLVPGAPLLWPNVDESLAREIDDILQKENDKVEILRRVFYKSRNKARDYINIQLQEFQVKRTAGLGTMYGPTDQQLQSAKGDKVKEQRVVEETLLPKLQQYLEEIEKESPKECPKKLALCSALSTVLQRFFVTRSNPGSPIDKVHHFVSREKSFKSRLMAKNRKQDILGHNLRLQPYYEVTRCNHCQNILWGVSPQGYHCSNCELNIHRVCAKDLNECCPGPALLKNDSSKITKLMEKISSRNHHQADKMKRHDDDGAGDDTLGADRPSSISLARQPSDRRQDFNNSSYLGNVSSYSDYLSNSAADPDTFAQSVDNDQFRDSVKSKSAPVSVNRSESYKERSQKKTRNTRRKTSDPSLTKTTDEQNEASSLINNYSSSSTSSLPLALDSRSTSLEAVGGVPVGSSAGPGVSTGVPVPCPNVSATANSSGIFSSPGGPGNLANLSSGTIILPTAREWVDSEDEGNLEPEVDWSSNIPAEILATLCSVEKKRQEVINEIYQTERNHVRTLRLLEGIFMRPLQESGALSLDLLQLLFPPSLRKLQELHTTFESNLKQRRIDHCNIIREIGDLLALMFDGQSGDDLKEHAAYFCARQQIALEALKERRKKDEHLQRLLIKAESHKACRRLQLKDLLPTVLQRLTKYPLLFDNLYNFTVRSQPDNEAEAQAIKKALDSSKRILDHVNQAVRTEEDNHKLITIQRKLDKSGLDKDASSEFKNIDLTIRKLIHDGPLTMKKNSGVQLHGLLFEDMMVLLQKQDDKYLLKYHSSPGLGGSESKITEGRFNPITKINLILVRQSAVDKNTFFLINTNVSQMLELTAPSSSECKTWFKHISDAADAYKARTKGTHEYGEDASSNAGQPPKDSFETVTEAQKIEQTSTPIDRLERKDSSLQCRAISTGGPGSGVGGTATSASANSGLNNNEDSLPNKNRTANENDDNVENEEKEKIKRRSMLQDYNGSGDTGPEDEDDYGPDSRGRGLSNTRTLTQQCSLVAPSEIHVSVSNTLTAEPILTPSEKLRRLDQAIRRTLVEKQRVVCDMFKVPDEHFLAIADIAAQPEAPQKEPTDIILAAFSHIQSLTDVLNEHMRVSQSQEISAVSTSVCDECNRRASSIKPLLPLTAKPLVLTAAIIGTGPELNGSAIDAVSSSNAGIQPSVGAPPIASMLENDQVNITEDEDGYCEIDEVRAAAVLLESQLLEAQAKKLAAEAATYAEARAPDSTSLDDSGGSKTPDSHFEINDNYDSTQNHLPPKFTGMDLCGRNRLLHASVIAPTIPCHLIASHVTGLNAQISQLLPKISERDLEREQLKRENQHLRELLNAMHQERVLETQETTEVPVTDPELQQQQPQPEAQQSPPVDIASDTITTTANVNE